MNKQHIIFHERETIILILSFMEQFIIRYI